jgi:hypothetical protein
MPRKEIKPVQIGQRFGRLLVEVAGHYCGCVCDCGNVISVRRDHLKSGATQSCGCLHSERSSARTDKLHKANVTHGKTGTRLHGIWLSIKQRCGNPNNPAFKDYGARGIAICDRWLDFNNFFKDMGEPAPLMTIDRINVNGNYEPSNCRWASRQEQMLNTRTVKLFTYNGETKSLGQWSREIGIPRRTLENRVRLGWSMKEVVETPVLRRK